MPEVKYHITKDGKFRICTARYSCPLGGKHYNRAEVQQTKHEGKEGIEAYNDVKDQLANYDDVHYRVYLNKTTGQPIAVPMQSFDYYDADGSLFLNKTAYKTEAQARYDALNFNDSTRYDHVKETEEVEATIDANYVYRRNLSSGKTSTDVYYDISHQLRSPTQAHWRTYYSGRTGSPVTICVQDFDYVDYDPVRFLDDEAYFDESSAEQALKEYY
jgi:hypothetical protein